MFLLKCACDSVASRFDEALKGFRLKQTISLLLPAAESAHDHRIIMAEETCLHWVVGVDD